MLPRVKLEAVADGIESSFDPVLTLTRAIDVARPREALVEIVRHGDTAHLVDVTAANPFAWGFLAELGLDRANGATNAGCLGDVADQSFVGRVLVPTYREAIAARQPVVHRIAAVANGVLLSYRRLTVPIQRSFGSGPPNYLLLLTRIELAIRLNASHASGELLSCRERQCLSLAAAGQTTKQIAAALALSQKTVEFHLASIRRKLGARTTAHAIALALIAALAEHRPFPAEPEPAPTGPATQLEHRTRQAEHSESVAQVLRVRCRAGARV